MEEESPAVEEEVKHIEDDVKEKKYSNIFEKISIIDDNNLPSFQITMPEAMIEMMKNPKCKPYNVYLSRWTELKKKYDRKNSVNFYKENKLSKTVDIDDSLLPSIDLTFPVAISKIKNNKACVPFELYVKRWNELNTLTKHKKRFNK